MSGISNEVAIINLTNINKVYRARALYDYTIQ
jgi:hypothetical protein